MKTLRRVRVLLTIGWIVAFILVSCCLTVAFTNAALVKAAGFNLPMMQVVALFAGIMVALMLPALVGMYFPHILTTQLEVEEMKKKSALSEARYMEAIDKLTNAVVSKALAPYPREEQIAKIKQYLVECREAERQPSATEVYRALYPNQP